MIIKEKSTYIFYVAVLMVFLAPCDLMAQNLNPDYSEEFAKKLGADDYGMKSYIFVMLKTGSRDSEITDKTHRDSLFTGHLANIQRLVEEEKMIVAGPLGNNENSYRGIFILNTTSMVEAQKMLETDPAVKAKILEADLYSWYGSAALSVYLEAAKKVGKYTIN